MPFITGSLRCMMGELKVNWLGCMNASLAVMGSGGAIVGNVFDTSKLRYGFCWIGTGPRRGKDAAGTA